MSENDNGKSPAATGALPVTNTLGPGDTYVICAVPAGTEALQIITDGSKAETEYALMLTAALNSILVKMHTQPAKEKSRILDPFARLRSGR